MRKIVVFFIILSSVVKLSAQTQLWGMTEFGGKHDAGVIFSSDSAGNNFTVEYDFLKTKGASPYYIKLVQATDGMLYGVTDDSEPTGYGNGILFQYNPKTSVYTAKAKLGIQFGMGSNAKGSLIQASDGKLYGMTTAGGLNNAGVIYQYDLTTNVIITVHDFEPNTAPTGALVQASDGNLYGTTPFGGLNNFGIMFKYNPATTVYTKILDFTSATGINPYGSMIQATDGNLYGMTHAGVSSSGSIFQYNINTNAFTKKIAFGPNDGDLPFGSLMQATDGKLYGMTNLLGTIFSYDIFANLITKKFDFNGINSGSHPYGDLIQASDGNLYGVTSKGGVADKGVLFQFDPILNKYTKKYDFDTTKGMTPLGSLMQASDGMLYGVTNWGGANQAGLLFQYNPTNSLTTSKIDFLGTRDGNKPKGSLMQASNGKLYGVTYAGGAHDFGVIFQFNPSTHTYTKVYDFESLFGIRPSGALIEGSDGKLYGLTSWGGAKDFGTIFQFDTITHTVINKFDFDGVNSGSHPAGALMQAIDGKLYGMTYNGGSQNYGVLFQYDPVANIFINKRNFGAFSSSVPPYDMFYPKGSLIQASDGMLYGMTSTNDGALFQYNPITNILYAKKYFSGSPGYYQGSSPSGSLIEASDGKIYGLTELGGLHNHGVLFQFDKVTNVYSTKFDFGAALNNPAIGGYSNGESKGNLIETEPGKFYGLQKLGAFNNGSTFQYDLNSDTIKNTHNFNSVDGRSPCYSSLIETGRSISSIITNTDICAGSAILVPYKVNGVFQPTNVFTAQLSDAFGSFVNPINIGSITSVASGTISAIIPSSTIPGNGYKLRVINSNLSILRIDNGAIITISNSTPSLTSTGGNTLCVGSTTGLTVSGATSYSWDMGTTTPTISGTYIYTVTEVNGCGVVTETISVFVDISCADVWPGDANSDGEADNLDVLELGLHYTQTGSPRVSVSNAWQSYFANNWTGTITNGKNLNHSDCNGDGVINNDDTLAIFNNYNLTHAFKTEQTTTNPQLTIVPNQAMVAKGTWGTASVYLGDISTPINSINGIAYTINYDKTLLEVDSVWIEYPISFINATNQNLNFRKRDFANNKLYTATTHTMNGDVSGYGKIAVLHYKTKTNSSIGSILNLSVNQAHQSNANGAIIPLTGGSTSITISVGLNELSNGYSISIYPNPAKDLLTIDFTDALDVADHKIELTNALGQVVQTVDLKQGTTQVNISQLQNGVYFVNILSSNKQIGFRKIVIQK